MPDFTTAYINPLTAEGPGGDFKAEIQLEPTEGESAILDLRVHDYDDGEEVVRAELNVKAAGELRDALAAWLATQ